RRCLSLSRIHSDHSFPAGPVRNCLLVSSFGLIAVAACSDATAVCLGDATPSIAVRTISTVDGHMLNPDSVTAGATYLESGFNANLLTAPTADDVRLFTPPGQFTMTVGYPGYASFSREVDVPSMACNRPKLVN